MGSEKAGSHIDAAEKEPHTVFVSLGSNMGRRRQNLLAAAENLNRLPLTTVIARSELYKTEPVDYTEQDWFANAAVKLDTGLSPHELLGKLQELQRNAGRKKDAVRFGPRLLDLDILLFDERIMETEALTIPHPRMHKRRFVLKPICDIDPDIVHPLLGKTMRQLLNGLKEELQAVVVDPRGFASL